VSAGDIFERSKHKIAIKIKKPRGQVWWFKPGILAIWEAEIREIQASPGKKFARPHSTN
jgi:hypothetical protein